MGNKSMERCKPLHLFRVAMIALLLLAGISVASASPVTVSGTVTQASDGEPLIGVSVLVKGTSQGTATDIDGNYVIKVEKGATLVPSANNAVIQQSSK